MGWHARDGRLRGSEQPREGKCARQLRGTRPPRYCCRPPMIGMTCCDRHGGKSPAGVAAPRFRGAGRSRLVPVRLRDSFEQARKDPELLSQRHNLAMARARVDELTARLDTGEEASVWAEARSSAQAFREARRRAQQADARGDEAALAAAQEAMSTALTRLLDLIDRGASNEAVWEQVWEAMRREGSLAQKEWRRMADARELLTKEQGLVIIGTIAALVHRHVKDRDALKAISDGLYRVVNRRQDARDRGE